MIWVAECKANGATVMQEFYAQDPDELGKEVEQKKQELKEWTDDVSKCKWRHYFLNFLSLCQVQLNAPSFLVLRLVLI